jgi:mono/diheme cytochrome c family protein
MKPAQLPKAIVVTSWLATLILTVVWVACPPQRFLTSQEPASPTPATRRLDDHQAFFDSRIRPVLLGTCAKCHGSKKTSNNLRLDSRAGLLKGGDSGPAIVAGVPEKSLLIQAVRYTGEPKMPPNKKLPATVIADFERWVRGGAVFPDDVGPAGIQPAQKADPAASSGTPVAAATAAAPGGAAAGFARVGPLGNPPCQ